MLRRPTAMPVRLPPLPSLLLPLALLAGCVSQPELGAPTTATSGVSNVLATDWAKPNLVRRMDNLAERTVGLFSSELSAPRTMSWDRMVTAPDRRINNLERTGSELGVLATRGRFEHTDDLTQEVDPDHIAHDLAENMAGTPMVLGLDRPMLPEIDDKRHRTDPFDDSPEASWIDRLRRRLRL